MAKKDYSGLEKDELLKVIKKLESSKKYGLVWDEEKEPEQVVLDCENNIPILQEEKTKEIKTTEIDYNILRSFPFNVTFLRVSKYAS